MTDVTTLDALRQRFIEDMTARNRGPASQKSHLRAYKRFSGWLQRSADTATADEVRAFQLHLAETGVSIITRNATMSGLKFLYRVTMRRHDLAAEIFHLNEPQKVALICKRFTPSRETQVKVGAGNRLRCRSMATRPTRH